MSNGENEGNILKTLAIIILVITAITLVFLFIHDRTVGEAGDSSNVSQTSESVSAANTGACIIGPKRVENGVVKLGEGINNNESVCDAATQGCGTCWDQCTPYVKIIDNYGCAEDYSQDGWCNPNAPIGADLDCDRDGDGYPAGVDCDDKVSLVNPGANEICFDGRDNDCDGYVDMDDQDCEPDGFCAAWTEDYRHPDCVPTEGTCPLFDERIIDQIETVAGPGTLFLGPAHNPDYEVAACNWTVGDRSIAPGELHRGYTANEWYETSGPASWYVSAQFGIQLAFEGFQGSGAASQTAGLDYGGAEPPNAVAEACKNVLVNACG